MAASSVISLSVVVLALLAVAGEAAIFKVVNQCPYTVWAASVPAGASSTAARRGPSNVPAGTTAARIWARTGCRFDGSGRGSCRIGNCGGVLRCAGYGRAPNTLAEFALNQFSNLDFFDISVIDGYVQRAHELSSPTVGRGAAGGHAAPWISRHGVRRS
jgi:hypothetical protein